MAKLTKQEIQAIANKTYKKLKIAEDEDLKKAISSYTPTDNYKEIKDLLDKRDSLNEEIEKLKEEKSKCLDSIEEKLRKYYNTWYSSKDSAECLCDYIVRKECKIKDIPTIEDLKDDITIATINPEFDVELFITEKINDFRK